MVGVQVARRLRESSFCIGVPATGLLSVSIEFRSRKGKKRKESSSRIPLVNTTAPVILVAPVSH